MSKTCAIWLIMPVYLILSYIYKYNLVFKVVVGSSGIGLGLFK